MYLCFIDESGKAEINESGAHFVLVGVCIPAIRWNVYERRLQTIKDEFELKHAEIHASLLFQPYVEQDIPGFKELDHQVRRTRYLKQQKVIAKRTLDPKKRNSLKKQQSKRQPYLHLTENERKNVLLAILGEFAAWKDCQLFVCAVDAETFSLKTKLYYPALIHLLNHLDICAEDSNGAKAIANTSGKEEPTAYILVHDQIAETRKATELTAIVEQSNKHIRCGPTPLFVDSQCTNLLQLADVCAFAVRNYLYRGNSSLLQRVISKIRNLNRHITAQRDCSCLLCQ